MKSTFQLRTLMCHNFLLWVVAFGFGIFAAISAIGLLAVSGWFITTASLVGVAALAVPASAWIQLFAVGRIVGRYGDLMTSHQAVFGLLRQLRLQFLRHLLICPLVHAPPLVVATPSTVW